MKISFIIPTLNEEKRISTVIGQFDHLKSDYDIIVADGGSDDNTVKIAKKLGATVVQNKKEIQTVAMNRNLGADKAQGEILIFCDADTKIKDVSNFIDNVLKEFSDNRIVAGMPKIEIFPDERIWKDFFIHLLYGPLVRLSVFLHIPFSGGQCQIVRKDAFFKVGGYDAYRIHAEDTFLFRKLDKIGKIHYFKELRVYESPRRYRKLGYIKLAFIAAKSYFSQVIFKKNTLKQWEKIE